MDFDVMTHRVRDTSTYDGPTPGIVAVNDDELLLVYRRGAEGHFGNEGCVVGRRSRDRGRTWTDADVIHDEPGLDTREPNLVYDPEMGRIVLFDLVYEVVETPGEDLPRLLNEQTYRLESTDGGRTWTNPTRITDWFPIEQVRPFGGRTHTSRGLMTQFYSRPGTVVAAFSPDGGRTWPERRTVARTPPDAPYLLSEPVSCAISPRKVLLFGRDNARGGYYCLRSADGGQRWTDPVFFDPTDGATPNPIWVKRTGADEVTAVWGDRDDLRVYLAAVSASELWDDPTALAEAPRISLHEHVGTAGGASYYSGDAGDFGYATYTELADRTVVAFYDEDRSPNVWTATLS